MMSLHSQAGASASPHSANTAVMGPALDTQFQLDARFTQKNPELELPPP